MPRRAKLTILALFLVLLGIPVAYIALTWYPPHPLRFRLVHVYPEEHRDDNGHRMLRLSVQNPNPTPVHLFFVRLGMDRARPDQQWIHLGSIDPRAQDASSPANSQQEFILPAHGTTHVTAFLQPELVDDAFHEGMSVHYLCMSNTRYRAACSYAWLRGNCPQSLQKLLPPVQEPPRQTVPVEPAMK